MHRKLHRYFLISIPINSVILEKFRCTSIFIIVLHLVFYNKSLWITSDFNEFHIRLQNAKHRMKPVSLCMVSKLLCIFRRQFLYLLVKDNDKFLSQPHSKIIIIQCKTTIIFLRFHYFTFASACFFFFLLKCMDVIST